MSKNSSHGSQDCNERLWMNPACIFLLHGCGSLSFSENCPQQCPCRYKIQIAGDHGGKNRGQKNGAEGRRFFPLKRSPCGGDGRGEREEHQEKLEGSLVG